MDAMPSQSRQSYDAIPRLQFRPKENSCLSKAIRRCLASVCNPSSLIYKYVILTLICVVKLSFVYSIDLPAALEHTIIDVMRVSVTEYELLYSLYSWPNVVLLLIGGVVVDRVLGLRLALVIFTVLGTLGQFLFALGAFVDLFLLMAIGRFVVGCGTGLALFTADTFAASLFKNRELSFVFGLLLGASRIGSTFNLNFSPKLFDLLSFISNSAIRLGGVLLLAFFIGVVGLVLSLIVIILDKRRSAKTEKSKHFKLADLKDFSPPLWIFVAIGCLFFIPIVPFISIAEVFYEKKFSYAISTAGLVNGVVYVVPALTYPLVGLLFDWTGYKLFWGMLLILGTQACHYAFAFTGPVFIVPIIGSLFLGTLYCMFTAAVWPQVFLLVQEHQIATAYGVLYASYELGQAVGVIVVGIIVDKLGYFMVELFFASVASLTFLLIIILYLFDVSGKQVLNMSGQRKRKLNKMKEQEDT